MRARRYNHAAALFLVFWTDITGCFFFRQDPVCPKSNPACLNDHDPTIWNPNGGDIYRHGEHPDAGADGGDARDASSDVAREAAPGSK